MLRLRLDLPLAEETTSSFVDRLASAYGLTRKSLFGLLDPSWVLPTRCPDLDLDFPPNLRTAIASSLGLSELELPVTLSEVRHELRAHGDRNTYCPLCFEDDLKAGRTPYFRWRWAQSLVTSCHVHRTPLFIWRSLDQWSMRVLPVSWTAAPSPAHAERCPHFVSDLTRAKRLIVTPSDSLAAADAGAFENALLMIDRDDVGRVSCSYRWPQLIDLLFSLGSSYHYLERKPIAMVVVDSEPDTGLVERPVVRRLAGAGFDSIQILKLGAQLTWQRALNAFASRALFGIGGQPFREEGPVPSPISGRDWLTRMIPPRVHPELQERVFRAARGLLTAAWQGPSTGMRADEPDQLAVDAFESGWKFGPNAVH